MWFKDWFNSPYYHILYSTRDYSEAETFVSNLVDAKIIPASGNLLDVACGSGRHSVSFYKKGYNVTGIDLSPENILLAKKREVPGNLEFFVHDMRQPVRVNYYDIVVNLFTSFGYFKTDHEHLKALKAFHSALKKDGTFVLDFLNAKKVTSAIVNDEIIERGGIKFHIIRRLHDGFIEKRIRFEDDGKSYDFVEMVKAYDLSILTELLSGAGFKIINLHGDYSLKPFDAASSPRLIISCKK